MNGRRYVEYSDGVTLSVGNETIEVGKMVNGYWTRMRYQGYTRRQCVAMFREYIKPLEE
jgi:hypothetical protein